MAPKARCSASGDPVVVVVVVVLLWVVVYMVTTMVVVCFVPFPLVVITKLMMIDLSALDPLDRGTVLFVH